MENNIHMIKKQLRKKVLQEAANLDINYKKKSSKAIRDFIYSMEDFQKAEVVFCFIGRKNEVYTKELIDYCWQEGKRVAVPLVVSKGIMVAKEIRSFEDLHQGIMNILEPKEDCPTIEADQIDFGVIPCVTCSHKGDRLGFGGGFYDRYMEGQTFPRACVCYEKLTSEEVPMSQYDQKVDYLITEIGIHSFIEK